jgi:hypothetical protein
LYHDRSRSDPLVVAEISNLQLEQISGPQLAVDTEIEERQFSLSAKDLKPDADSPDLFKFEWCFLTNKFALVPSLGTIRILNSSIAGSSRLEEPQPDPIL